MRDVRARLTERLRMAQGDDGVHTVVLVDGQPRGVMVSMPWRRKAAAALGEPFDLTQVSMVGVTPLREGLSSHVGGHVIATRRSELVAALVPWDWYVRAAAALGEPLAL